MGTFLPCCLRQSFLNLTVFVIDGILLLNREVISYKRVHSNKEQREYIKRRAKTNLIRLF
nr:MAG TPA: hypothetical protein [Microviridae sp.]